MLAASFAISVLATSLYLASPYSGLYSVSVCVFNPAAPITILVSSNAISLSVI
nr:MAG TPA: hypothetical protein [Caudoviricetes sp.]